MHALPYAFDAEKILEELIQWIQQWFKKNGKGCTAVVGISGGKDSSVVASLCVRALGKERVLGVLMPDGVQPDIDMARLLVSTLGIEALTINIADVREAASKAVSAALGTPVSEQTRINMPPRLRMTILYAVSQSRNGRVANTCNLSEDWIGYSTRYGDSAGDFSPLANLTVGEVIALGKQLGLPDALVNKAPADGLCGKTDEDNLGFCYADLDLYLRNGQSKDASFSQKIDSLRLRNRFKLEVLPSFPYAAPGGAPKEPDREP